MKFNIPYITNNELKNIEEVFKNKNFHGMSRFTDECNNKIGEFIGAQNVLLTDSCTSALEISALLIKNWDKNEEQEIIMPSYTFSSTAAAFLKFGFKLVFCEIDPKNMMMNIDDAISRVTERTAAIVPVHYAGLSLELSELKDFCNKEDIYLIEDAAQSYGCFFDTKAVGTSGDLSCFSFHETKNLHAGLAGALIVNNDKFKKRALHIAERGTNREEVLRGIKDKYSWVEIGGSYYPTEIQAAFLSAQLESFDESIKKRKQIFEFYENTLSKLDSKETYITKTLNGYKSNYHAFWIIFESIDCCEFVRKKLFAKDIPAYIGYVPLHSSKVGKSIGYKADDLKLTEEYSQRLLRLPLHTDISLDDAEYVTSSILSALDHYDK